MHIARQTSQQLVVVDGTRWVSAICVAGALFGAWRTYTTGTKQGLIMFGVLGLFAMLFDLRKVFTFDRTKQVVRWKGRTILKTESGEIPFDKITNIDTEITDTTNKSSTITLYRLAINASGTSIPMAYNYRGVKDGYSALRTQILEFIKPGWQIESARSQGAAAESLDSSLRALLRQNRKVDAIALLRSSENMSMTEAMQRIDAIECGLQQEE